MIGLKSGIKNWSTMPESLTEVVWCDLVLYDSPVLFCLVFHMLCALSLSVYSNGPLIFSKVFCICTPDRLLLIQNKL